MAKEKEEEATKQTTQTEAETEEVNHEAEKKKALVRRNTVKETLAKKKNIEKAPPNAKDVKLQPLILANPIIDKKKRIDQYKGMMDDLTMRMEKCAQPDPDVLAKNKLNEEDGANPYEQLTTALLDYSNCFPDRTIGTRLVELAGQCASMANIQRDSRDKLRISMRHARRFSVKEYVALHTLYTEMEDSLAKMDLARNAVRDCQNPNELDKIALAFKQSICTFEANIASVQAQLNGFDGHVLLHAQNIVSYMSMLKIYYAEQKITKVPGGCPTAGSVGAANTPAKEGAKKSK